MISHRPLYVLFERAYDPGPVSAPLAPAGKPPTIPPAAANPAVGPVVPAAPSHQTPGTPVAPVAGVPAPVVPPKQGSIPAAPTPVAPQTTNRRLPKVPVSQQP
ncbi:hypothetical protein EVG20_g11406, partial [Dentipellis fragilis]